MSEDDAPLGGSRRLSADERRYYREWSVICGLGLALLALFTALQWGQSIGLVVHDQFQRWWPAQPSPQVVVIEIDDHTLEQQGGWPLKRSVYADLLRKLADTGNHPHAIGFDILFPDVTAADPALAAQMRRHRVYLASELSRSRTADGGPILPLSPPLKDAARGVAHVNLSFEKDGSIRGAHLIEDGVPHLALAMAEERRASFEQGHSYRRLHFMHPQDAGASASLTDVLSGLVPAEFFKGKYVLIGATAASLGDHFPTLHSGQHQSGTPGVMLHANLLANLLGDALIEPLALWQQVAVSCLVLLTAMLAVLVLSPLAELLVNLTIAACTLAISGAALVLSHTWFDPGLCVVAIALFKPTWVWRRNEMIVSYMGQRAATLAKSQRRRKTLGFGLRLRHFASDTLMQYSRLLDKAIDMVSNRLTFLQRLVEQVPVAMLVADDEGRILLANPGMTQVFPTRLVGPGQSVQGLLEHLGLPHDRLQLLSLKDQHVSADVDGSGVRHFILRMASIDEGGDSPLWILSLTDVTEMRQFQAQRERTLQLLSHDMRTPVASIMALSRSERTDSSKPSANADIQRHAGTLLGMMDDFIFSIQAQDPRYRLVEVLMEDLIDEAIHQVRDLARTRDMPLQLEQGEEPLFVRADPRLFVRALVNLLLNAVRHGQHGTPIHIRVARIDTEPAAPKVQCSIVNTVGIPQTGPHPETGRSFGLGLAFVRTVVQKHDGDVQLQIPAAAGQNARVELTLPLLP